MGEIKIICNWLAHSVRIFKNSLARWEAGPVIKTYNFPSGSSHFFWPVPPDCSQNLLDVRKDSVHFACFHGRISVLKHCFKTRIISTASLASSLMIFVVIIFICFCFSRQTLRHNFIHWKNILFQNVWNRKHRCWTFLKTWMCKAHVLMQSPPFRWEE